MIIDGKLQPLYIFSRNMSGPILQKQENTKLG
jgi:hypothetical protein